MTVWRVAFKRYHRELECIDECPEEHVIVTADAEDVAENKALTILESGSDGAFIRFEFDGTSKIGD